MRIIAAIGLALAAPAVVAQSPTTTPAAPAALPVRQPTPVAVTAPARPAPNAYRISPGDQIDIYVWGDERLQRSLVVLPDGSFAFPLAGTVYATGRTPPEVEAELSKLLAPQYKGVPPQVTISVRAPTGMQISIIGKVRSPGNLTPTRYIDVLGALALAGGPTDFADVGGIIVLRKQGDRTIVIRSRLSNILKGHPSADDLSTTAVPQLQAGDTVVVP